MTGKSAASSSCYCADPLQISQALWCIKCRWFIRALWNLVLLLSLNVLYAVKYICSNFHTLCYVRFFYVITTGIAQFFSPNRCFVLNWKAILSSKTVLSNTNIHNIEIPTTKPYHLFSTCSEYSWPYLVTLQQTKPKSSCYDSDWLHSKQSRIQDRTIICVTCLEHGRTVRRERTNEWLAD